MEDIKNSELITNPATDIHSLVDQYNAILAGILNSHAPEQQKQEAILEAKPARRRAERKWLSSRLHVDMDILQEARKQVNKLCKTAKRKYYIDKIKKKHR